MASCSQVAEGVVPIEIAAIGTRTIIASCRTVVVSTTVGQRDGDTTEATVGSCTATIAVMVVPDATEEHGTRVVAKVDIRDRLVTSIDGVEVGQTESTRGARGDTPDAITGSTGEAAICHLVICRLGLLGTWWQRVCRDATRQIRIGCTIGDLHYIETGAQTGEAVVPVCITRRAHDEAPAAYPRSLASAVSVTVRISSRVELTSHTIDTTEEFNRYPGDANITGIVASRSLPTISIDIAKDPPADRAIAVDRDRIVIECYVSRTTAAVACPSCATLVDRRYPIAPWCAHPEGRLNPLALARVERTKVLPDERPDRIGGTTADGNAIRRNICRDKLEQIGIVGIGQRNRAEDRIIVTTGLVRRDHVGNRIEVHLTLRTVGPRITLNLYAEGTVAEVAPTPAA